MTKEKSSIFDIDDFPMFEFVKTNRSMAKSCWNY